MRIVAGTFRSRTIKAVDGTTTRPTTDKIKEAIFSRIGPYFDGGVMLDLFGGSGNMGFEALSRGIDEVYYCDMDRRAIQTMKMNANTLDVMKQCHIHKSDYKAMLKQCAVKNIQFSFIFLDPPYKKQQINEILYYIADNNLLANNGNIVCESLKEDDFVDSYGDLVKLKDVTYGITRITYYTRRCV